jgi:hypothetical protein
VSRPGDEVPRSEIVLDFDATLVTAHSEKEGATGNYKSGFGFYPLLCNLKGSREALAGMLRSGKAGANTAARRPRSRGRRARPSRVRH